MLQCGHDPKAVENAVERDLDVAVLNASMRPRPEGRGEPSAGVPVRSRVSTLQCGHDPKAVENEG